MGIINAQIRKYPLYINDSKKTQSCTEQQHQSQLNQLKPHKHISYAYIVSDIIENKQNINQYKSYTDGRDKVFAMQTYVGVYSCMF